MAMEPCVVIASSSEKVQPDSIIRDILETEALPEPLRLVDGVRSYLWKVNTKYYDAQVHLCAMDEKTIGNEYFARNVNAVILCFDSDSDIGISNIEQWHAYTKEFGAEIRILICNRCYDSQFPKTQDSLRPGISKTEALEWCISHGFELVELSPEEPEEEDLEDDFPESLGIKRVVEALKAHVWPNLQLKDRKPRSKIASRDSSDVDNSKGTEMKPDIAQGMKRNHEELVDQMLESVQANSADSISEESFEALFENLSTMKSKAANLPPTQRKDYAKEMTFAFWRAMGGNESELEDSASEDEPDLDESQSN